jgi:hypothetical protein
MGVPVPGERPIILITEQVKAALKGVTVTDAAIGQVKRCAALVFSGACAYREGMETQALEVTYTHGMNGHSGRGRIVFYDRAQDRSGQMSVRTALREWAEKQRARRLEAATGAKPTARVRAIYTQIKRLERQKPYIGEPPVNPLIPQGRKRLWLREHVLAWYQQKPQRQAIGRIAMAARMCKIANATAYRKLKDMGLSVIKWGRITDYQRRQQRIDGEIDYWQHLYKFVSGMQGERHCEDYRNWEDRTWQQELAARLQEHKRVRQEYLDDKRQIEATNSQIADLKAMTREPKLRAC